MDNELYEELKIKFLKAVANVPPPLRREIIAMVGKDAFTWLTAREEVIRDTKNAEHILKQLKDMGVL